MAISPQFAETSLTGTLTSSLSTAATVGTTFTAKMNDKNTGASRTPNANTRLFSIGRGTSSYEILECTHSTASGVTTFTIVANGLPLTYSTTPLTTVSANVNAHFAGDEISVVDIATYLNIIGLKLNGTDDFSNALKYSGQAASFTGAGRTNLRSFADATARDAAIPSPQDGDKCKLVSPVAEQFYDAGTASWQTNGTVSAVNDASTTVKGIVEVATTAETLAGTDTGGTSAKLVALPSDIAKNVQNQAHVYADDSVGTDSYAITLPVTPAALAAGQRFSFKAGTANTGGATLAVNGLAATPILKFHDQALETGDIESGQIVDVEFDGTNFQMQSPVASQMSTADVTDLTDGGTTTLHTHNFSPVMGTIEPVGTTSTAGVTDRTITHSFGSTPSYIKLKFNLVGHDASTGTNVYLSSYGEATFDGSNSLLQLRWLAGANNGNSQTSEPLADDQFPSVISPATTGGAISQTIYAGSADNNSQAIRITLSLANIGTSTIDIRLTITNTAGQTNTTAYGEVSYEIYP